MIFEQTSFGTPNGTTLSECSQTLTPSLGGIIVIGVGRATILHLFVQIEEIRPET